MIFSSPNNFPLSTPRPQSTALIANMKFTSAIAFSVSLLALFADANPIAEPEAALDKRDVVCKVASNVVCRWGPGSSSFVRRRDITTSETFGVKCTEKNSAGKYVPPALENLKCVLT
jgi:hypothetical protein